MTRLPKFLSFAAAFALIAITQSTSFADVNAEIRAHNADVSNYDLEAAKYDGALKLYKNELRAYESECNWHNNLPPTKRTDFQYRRLLRWKKELDSRYYKLVSMHSKLEVWRKNINERARRLNASR